MGQGMLRGRAVEGQRRDGLAPMREGRVLGSGSSHLVALLLPRPTESVVVVGLRCRESGHCLLLRGSRERRLLGMVVALDLRWQRVGGQGQRWGWGSWLLGGRGLLGIGGWGLGRGAMAVLGMKRLQLRLADIRERGVAVMWVVLRQMMVGRRR